MTAIERRKVQASIRLLEHLCHSPTYLPSDEILVLCKAVEVLADIVGWTYRDKTARFDYKD